MMDLIVSDAPAVDIVDVTIDNFMSEVIEASNSKGNCTVLGTVVWISKQLGPVLEKVISGQKICVLPE